jgi:spore germination protein GerM
MIGADIRLGLIFPEIYSAKYGWKQGLSFKNIFLFLQEKGMKTQHTYPGEKILTILYIVLLLTVVGGTGWWTWHNPKPQIINENSTSSPVNQLPSFTNPSTNKPSASESRSTEASRQKDEAAISTSIKPSGSPIKSSPVQLQPQTYWLKVEGDKINLIAKPVTVKAGISKQEALTTTLNYLLSNPQKTESSTTIPTGTKLLSLRVTKSGIYVNLSREFSQGGGSTSMIYRVAQVLYTASSIDSKDKVYLLVEGQLLNQDNPLGGEGIILREPLTRETFKDDFSVS